MIRFWGYVQSEVLPSQIANVQSEADSVVSGVEMGRDWVLQSNWPFALGWWVTLLVASLVVLLLIEFSRVGGKSDQRESGFGWRRWLLLGLRALTMLLVLVMLGRWELARYEVDLPDLLLLVDRSASMSLPLAVGSGAG